MAAKVTDRPKGFKGSASRGGTYARGSTQYLKGGVTDRREFYHNCLLYTSDAADD